MIQWAKETRHFASVAMWGMGLLATGAAAADNPYAPIVVRNVFSLNPPAPAASSAADLPPPKITPNGIISIFGNSEALFKVTGHQPGGPAGDKSYLLGEGQREDDIEVIKIDEQTSTITFDNHGVIQEVPLVAGTASNGSTPAPGPVSPIINEAQLALHGNVWSTAMRNAAGLPGNHPGNSASPAYLGRLAGNYGNIGNGVNNGGNVYTPSGPDIIDGGNPGNNPPTQGSNTSYYGGDSVNDGSSESSPFDAAAEHLVNLQMVMSAKQRMQ